MSNLHSTQRLEFSIIQLRVNLSSYFLLSSIFSHRFPRERYKSPPKIKLAVGGTLGHAEKHLTSVIAAKITIIVASVVYFLVTRKHIIQLCVISFMKVGIRFCYFWHFFVQRTWSLFFYAFPPGGVSASHI